MLEIYLRKGYALEKAYRWKVWRRTKRVVLSSMVWNVAKFWLNIADIWLTRYFTPRIGRWIFRQFFRQYHQCFSIYRHFGRFFRKFPDLLIGQGAVKPFNPLVNTCTVKPLHIFLPVIAAEENQTQAKVLGLKVGYH